MAGSGERPRDLGKASVFVLTFWEDQTGVWDCYGVNPHDFIHSQVSDEGSGSLPHGLDRVPPAMAAVSL